MYDALTEGKATAALIASIVHYGEYTIPDLKRQISAMGAKMRMVW
jgi:cyclase